ncbi:sugar phosphate nucleotidyltransferase [Adhaeribacter aquaticus]|uniref:sugar phosphate nucleotidyltransferase n=1 Tax=Adhaeribacter aquaticus TaxID=299567 RepID=UPI000411F971|nr:sugar phosphate nucleotidyltransferase [Adhaeribacter aquaticus]
MTRRLLVLAGGTASRMKERRGNLTGLQDNLVSQADSLTKGMIGVGPSGRPLMDYLLYNAHKAGCTEVLLLLNPVDTYTQTYYESKMAENLVWGLHLFFARQHISPSRTKPAGTADAVLQALEQHPTWQHGQFVVCNSDNLYSENAFQLLWHTSYPHALISYNSEGLGFTEERIRAFAAIKTDAEGFVQGILEKPTNAEMAAIEQQGPVGVSMNIFLFEAAALLPHLQKTPFNPTRNEQELPTTVNLLVQDYPKSMLAIPLTERVPDLTSKNDLLKMQTYLTTYFPEL